MNTRENYGREKCNYTGSQMGEGNLKRATWQTALRESLWHREQNKAEKSAGMKQTDEQ